MGTLKLNNVTAITESGGAITYAAGSIPDVKLTPTATASAPSGVRGALYYDSDKETLMQHNGTDWIRIREEAPTASGGIITEHGTYRVHTFLSSGIFTVLNSSLACNILIVAGGGAGGTGMQEVVVQEVCTQQHILQHNGRGGPTHSPSPFAAYCQHLPQGRADDRACDVHSQSQDFLKDRKSIGKA